MTTVTVEQAKSDLSELLARAEAGETIVIERDGKPTAQLGPTPNGTSIPTSTRRLGFMAGKIKVPEDFDEMMRDEIEEMFYGKP